MTGEDLTLSRISVGAQPAGPCMHLVCSLFLVEGSIENNQITHAEGVVGAESGSRALEAAVVVWHIEYAVRRGGLACVDVESIVNNS